MSDSLFEEIVLHELTTGEEEHSGSLAHLKILVLSKLPMLKHIVEEESPAIPVFGYLEVLQVSECSRLKLLVPFPSLIPKSVNFGSLSNCDGMINLN